MSSIFLKFIAREKFLCIILAVIVLSTANIIFGLSFIFSEKALKISDPLVILSVRFILFPLFRLFDTHKSRESEF